MSFRFEKRHHRLLSWPAFLRRMLLSAAVGLALVLVSLAIGSSAITATKAWAGWTASSMRR
jgi:hypothetical protein